jgi:hypothetical protein
LISRIRLALFFTLTSNWISRLFFYGSAFGGIEKMRSKFFQRRKSSGVPVTQPAGCGGKTDEFISVNITAKGLRAKSLILIF